MPDIFERFELRLFRRQTIHRGCPGEEDRPCKAVSGLRENIRSVIDPNRVDCPDAHNWTWSEPSEFKGKLIGP